MLETGLGPEWKPERAKFAMVKSEAGRHLTAFVDPGFPFAWRRAPYYENLKHWAVHGESTRPVSGRRYDRSTQYRDPPDRDVEVRKSLRTTKLHVAYGNTAIGRTIEVSKIKRVPAAA